MVKEITNKEDKGEGISSRVGEGIHLMFDFDKACLLPDL
jgi:hypothetical protein